ncbi:hypothetical protein [Nocardioides hwasunensis]|uniref:Nuclear transport factor 2 family protein n=1 Tax=Nocardioides hwasunensis TaxID=397258 RepID=A0ABR8MNA5_9ACTN|nr:hypothetical protein [Nocardioides hwasunensis]MBD3916019.1 hypothetical protein [Nocardioides hwasunensis]
MPSPAPGRSTWVIRCASLVLALLVPLVAGGCRSGSEPSASPVRPSQDAAQVRLTSHPVTTKTKIHRVFGRLPEARRKAVRRQVGEVVDQWWEASYLGGSYPRSSFPAAFPGFTKAAEKRARADKALLTNQTRGSRIDAVTARHRTISLDILATDGRARTATAAFVLKFDTDGELVGTTTVRGRLFLVRRDGAWRIFGYDVAKGSQR